MKEKLYNIFLIVFSLIFALILVGTIFDNKSLITVSPITIILSFIIIGLILILIYKFINKKITDNLSIKKEIIIVGIIFLIILIYQLIYAYYMKSYPGWDWNELFTSARNYVLDLLDYVDWEYFRKFPNNYGMLYFEIILFKMFNVLNILHSTTATIYATIAVNIVIINLSIFLTYLTIRNILGKKNAIYSLIIMSICNAFFCYIPILYTDTVTMIFPIFILFCYTLWNKNNKNWLLILIAIATVFGMKIKLTVVIMLIAIIIDLCMKHKLKKSIKPISILLISLLILQLSMSFLEIKFSIFPYDISNNNKQLPYTHWIMMGMTEREYKDGKYLIGWFNPESMEYTLSYDTTEEREKANIKKIQEYLGDYGIIGYTKFLYRKMLYTWSDGSYFSSMLLDNGTMYNKKSIFTDLQHSSGKYVKLAFNQNTVVILFIYLFIIIGAITALKKKENKVNTCYIALFGVLIFFLLWEASSRYLINYVPILIVGMMYGLSSLLSKDRNIQNKEEKNKKLVKNEEVLKMKKSPILYVVIPCYNEEEVLHETTKRMKEKMKGLIKSKKISDKSRVMYVNDGSKDKTWQLIKEIHDQEELFTGVTLSRNRGHQNALLAGLMTARNYADVVISMDADLQDDINAIDSMIDKYLEGCDIVYGVRSARKTDTWFKKTTAEGFYKVMKFLGVDVIYNHADYRLTSKRVLDEFANFKEVNLFLRGMFPLVGFKSDVVYYERNERFAGESKYPLKKMLNFAWDGITSFSVKPLRFICTLGFMILFVSIVIMIYSIIQKILGNTVAGWTFLSISIWFIGGLQMISIGIIGEYIGKMYNEAKQRPRFIISENLEEKN